MFYLLLIFMNMMNSSLILFMKHPLSMGLILLIQTVLICLTMGIFMKTFWFSYILFLIFLGGLLVLFIYVSSLASNEMFKFSKFLLSFLLILLTLLIILFFIFDKNFLLMNFLTLENFPTQSKKNYFLENSLSLNKLFNFPINYFTILLMIYLFLTLIVAVKITNLKEGPLRPKF